MRERGRDMSVKEGEKERYVSEEGDEYVRGRERYNMP